MVQLIIHLPIRITALLNYYNDMIMPNVKALGVNKPRQKKGKKEKENNKTKLHVQTKLTFRLKEFLRIKGRFA